MSKYIFKTTDSLLEHLNGQTCEIERTITEPEEGFDAEVLPMHVVKFEESGQTQEVWPDELTPVE
jgi:hypothetical protein